MTLFLLKCCFLIFRIQVAAGFIENKTTLNDRRHAGEVPNEVVVNIIFAKSQANLYKPMNLLFRPVDYLTVSINLNKRIIITS